MADFFHEEDREFYFTARTALPRLLADFDELEKELRTIREVLRKTLADEPWVDWAKNVLEDAALRGKR